MDFINCKVLCFFLLLPFYAIADPVVICQSDPYFFIDAIGGFSLTPAMIAQGYDNAGGTITLSFSQDINDTIRHFNCQILEFPPVLEVWATNQLGATAVCSTIVTIFDIVPPQIDTPTDITLDCSIGHINEFSGQATATDNCAQPQVTFTDEFLLDSCQAGQIIRTWVAEDDYRNTASGVQNITLVRSFSGADIYWPDNCAIPGCNGLAPENMPLNSRYPGFSNTGCVSLTQSFTDEQLADTLLARHWTVFEDCLSNSWTHTQLITFRDSIPPDVSCQDLSVCLQNSPCQEESISFSLTATDACLPESVSYAYAVDFYCDGTDDLSGISNNATAIMPVGTHNVHWSVQDFHQNTRLHTQMITVTDCVAPTPVAIPDLQLQLTASGTVSLNAAALNGGSFDNCSIAEMVLKYPSQGTNQLAPPVDAISELTFNCSHRGTQPVDFWVTDVNGNHAYLTANVEITDPDIYCATCAIEVICPEDITININQDPLDLNLTGDAIISGNCNPVTSNFTDTQLTSATCGCNSVIERQWSASDSFQNDENCIQTITVNNDLPITEADISWPPDFDLYEIDSTLNPYQMPDGIPVINPEKCHFAVTTWEDVIIGDAGSGCYEINRNWHIQDSCQLELPCWTHTQHIQVVDAAQPVFDFDQTDQMFCNDMNICDKTIQLTAHAQDNSTQESMLNYTYNLDFYNDGTIDISGNTKVIQALMPSGVHNLHWNVSDLCGNTNYTNQLVSISDCQAPTIITPPAFAIELGQNGFAGLETLAMGITTQDNCEIDGVLLASPTGIDPSTAGVAAFSLNCNDIGSRLLNLWVADAAGNEAFAEILVTVEASSGQCGCLESAELHYDMIDGQVFNVGANNFINADMTINPGAEVNLTAGGDILLDAGFEVKAGASFGTQNGFCSSVLPHTAPDTVETLQEQFIPPELQLDLSE